MKTADVDPPLSRQTRILVMDDEENIRNLAKKMLEKFGYIVETAADGDDAVLQYTSLLEKNTPPHLVILDLTIPGGMGGRDAAQILLDLDPDAKIVVSSGSSNDPIMEDYKKYRLKGIIPKPYQLGELKAAVEKILNETP